MIYRLRIYEAIPDKLPEFHRFFREHLLPIQLRHGGASSKSDAHPDVWWLRGGGGSTP